MIQQLIKQLLLLIVVAGLIGYTLYSFGVNIIIGILLGVVIQYAVFNAFLYIVDSYTSVRSKKLDVKRLQEMSYQGVEVTCPCADRHKQFVPIRLNSPNYYKCQKCNKTISIFTAVETAIVTEPIGDTDILNLDKLMETKLNESTGKH